MYRISVVLSGLMIALASSLVAHADIYLMDDFESYDVGDSLDSGDIWIVHQDALAPGEASDEVSYPPGGQSGYFFGQSGIKHIFSAGDLPDTFVISAYYCHDHTADPAPHYMLVFKGPGGSDWLGVGTVETVSNYSFRDKMGGGVEVDTGVRRKEWVNIMWYVTADDTTVLLDGEKVHTSTINGTAWSSEGSFIWFANCWVEEGEAYLDSLVIADTQAEIDQLMAVDARGKLSATWAALKIK